MSIVKDTILINLPPDKRKTPSGWISFNAPCCIHNGHSADERKRGGVIENENDAISYHCFNCGFKASWQPGRTVSYKLKNLLSWLGVSDNEINKLCLTVIKENEGVESTEHHVKLPEFSIRELPKNAVPIRSITEFNEHNVAVLEYIAKRNLELSDTEFYWSPDNGFHDRLIIPFYYNKNIVGWTARTITSDKKPKYLSDMQQGYVYGLDEQTYDKKFVIVCEGQIDAIHIKGCALGGSDISEQQLLLLKKLNKPVIIVPDRDKAGKKLISKALDNEWKVSMPDWSSDINDIGDAVAKYGRLYTLYSIVKSAEHSAIKVRLTEKKWFL